MMRSIVLSLLCSALAGCAFDAPPGAPPDAEGRAFVIRAAATLEVDGLDRALPALRRAIASEHGFVATEQESRSGARLGLRIPAERLDAVLEQLAGLGEVTRLSREREDVTEARHDEHARLRNARLEEERLIALLDHRAGTLADVLAIERELARVRSDIEARDATTRALEDRIAMAALELELVSRRGGWLDDPLAGIADALTQGTHVLWAILVGAATMLAFAAPSLVVLALALALVRVAWRVAALRAAQRQR